MKILADLTIVPMGVGVSLSPYVALIIKHLRSSNLKLMEHSMGTNIEGDWDEVMKVVKECNQLLIKEKVPRISTSLKISVRADREESMEKKLKSVNSKI